MSEQKHELPQVAAGDAGNPPPQDGVEARILGASFDRSKAISGHTDSADLDKSLKDIKQGTGSLTIEVSTPNPGTPASASEPGTAPRTNLNLKASTLDPRTSASASGQGTGSLTTKGSTLYPDTSASANEPGKVPRKRISQSKRQRIKAHEKKEAERAAAGDETPKGEPKPAPVSGRTEKPKPSGVRKVTISTGKPKGDPNVISTPNSQKRTRKDLSSTSSQGDSAKSTRGPKRLATDRGPVAAGNREGTTSTNPSRGRSDAKASTARGSFVDVARRATDVVFFNKTSPEGYTVEQSAIIRERLCCAVQEAQMQGVPLKLENPGGHRRMLKITPVDAQTRSWLKDYVESGKLDNAWNGAIFSLMEVGDLARRIKASMLVPHSSSQETATIIAQIKGTNPSLKPEAWEVFKNDPIERPVKGNLIHFSLPEEEAMALDKLNRTLYLGLHKVEIRLQNWGKRKTSPPRGSESKKRK